MIVHLRMYARPETQAAHDRFWALIRDTLGEGPHGLSKDSDFWRVWRKPALLLAQTCGLPYRSRLHDEVNLVGTPDYGITGCAPGHYHSVFVARADGPDQLADLAPGRFAYNEALSQSGWAAPLAHVEAAGLRFGPLVRTGAHRASAIAVAEGSADLAALDVVTWTILRRYDAFTEKLKVVATTAPTPGLPYITARSRAPEPIFAAVETAIERLDPADRETLMLRGLVHIPAKDYLSVPIPRSPADY